jgi:hypothetical protein
MRCYVGLVFTQIASPSTTFVMPEALLILQAASAFARLAPSSARQLMEVLGDVSLAVFVS